MVNLYVNPNLAASSTDKTESYSGYKEPDTKVPPKAKPVLDKVSVNGIEIPETDILAEAQHHPAENPGAALYQAARALVVRELLLQQARQLKISPHPLMEDDGKPETPEDALIRKVVDLEVKVPKATDEECRRFYKNNRERFSSGTIYEASHILLAGPVSDKPGRKGLLAKAKNLCKHLQDKPGDFKNLAREFSACSSAEQGGNLGQLTSGSTVEEFEQAIENADGTGLLQNPVESRFGVHVIRLDRIIPGSVLPYEQVEVRISSWLEASSWSKAVSQYVHILAGSADITGISMAETDGPLVQ